MAITDTDEYTYLMTYSFPCVDLSLAGKQAGMEKGSGTRSGLLWEVERLLNECEELPQILLMENVTQVHNKKNKPAFDKWCEFLESKGYTNYWQDLNAKDYGVPQSRNRCYMVSFLDGRDFNFPKPFELNLKVEDLLESKVDEKLYLKENSGYRFFEQAFEVLKENNCKSGDIIDAFNKKLNTTGVSPTITTRPEGLKTAVLVITNNFRIRKLTPKECWRLMGFDDIDFEKAQAVSGKSKLYKQAGNSIVVPVLEEIFKKILNTTNLYNEDCFAIMPNVPKARLLLTDIPYAVINRKDNGLRNLNKEKADCKTFELSEFLPLIYEKADIFIIFCSNEQYSFIYDWFYQKQKQKAGTVRQIVWCKSNPSPMNGEYVYLSGTENAVWFKKSGTGKLNCKCKKNFFIHPTGSSKYHPTEKNHKLLRELIEDNTCENDLVIDCCMGSGSTGIVCRELNRRFIGIELDKNYFDIAKNRIKEAKSND